ncbi:STAS/SEC14 domain-containing protein [Chondromyces crocatus]|uniref:STAS/SEC14 domain-containing protein n=1 Tax=Chondromyces crocatus TaxID=52 RepID=A0A0K1EB92_CHOCO|nr:STAS/SEC14 domain-containing protein [Chondromyces crocatus]AKT37957.1 uncharacterized protein CMC5_020980 [Chondromyces crocatus]
MSDPSYGRHTLTFHEPGVVDMVVRGDLSGDEMRQFLETVARFSRGRPHLLGIADLGEGGSVSIEARKIAADFTPRIPFRVLAYYRASFQMRLTTKLTLVASQLMSLGGGAPTGCEIRFFTTESEARAWIDERLRVLYPAFVSSS